MKTRIVEAKAADVPDILRFIKDLAAFETLGREVAATEETLRDSLFGAHADAEVVVVEEDGDHVAFALHFHNYSTFFGRPGLYLEDLYVRPEKRGKGHGRLLLRHLARLALARGCGRLEWWALDWNSSATDFYRSFGVERMADWTVYRLAGDALKRRAADGVAPEGPADEDGRPARGIAPPEERQVSPGSLSRGIQGSRARGPARAQTETRDV